MPAPDETSPSTPELATINIAHTVALQASINPVSGRPDVEKYLETFDQVYKRISATIKAEAPAPNARGI